MRHRILTVVGTRPNFIKVTQFRDEFARFGDEFEFALLHTGQHYDGGMSEVFFNQLRLREPDFYLGAAQGNPGEQTGAIISGLSRVITDWKPSLVMVVGDVNSTLAGAIAANKCKVKLAHVEAGLRSHDRTMPEEINRILTDEISDLLFVTEETGEKNLLAAGKPADSIFFVGNTMIDALVAFEPEIEESQILEMLNLTPGDFVLMTMHRPGNVDEEKQLRKLLELVKLITEQYRVVFPIHPRTRKNMERFGIEREFGSEEKLMMVDPLDYISFQKLIRDCKLVITDSGGIQEETTYRRIPCLTLRNNTERPSTVELGTNELIPFDLSVIAGKLEEIRTGKYKKGQIPPLWDGKATARMVDVLRKAL